MNSIAVPSNDLISLEKVHPQPAKMKPSKKVSKLICFRSHLCRCENILSGNDHFKSTNAYLNTMLSTTSSNLSF